jgi:hypothetical protein
MEPHVTGFYEATTGSVQYVVADPLTRRCAVIDPVLDFDPRSGSTRTTSGDRLFRHINATGLILDWILDTHPHADHLSAVDYLTGMTGAATGIGERVTEVQTLWKQLHNLVNTVATDGSQWDHLLPTVNDSQLVNWRRGHCCRPAVPSCSVTYVIGDAAHECSVQINHGCHQYCVRAKFGRRLTAVTVEPVSALKFPANRENNREVFNFGSRQTVRTSNPLDSSIT